ncbi:L-rhamnose mutarotase [Micromonospora sp. CPCC 205561]|uniref:L-rhamnose mutarotase n=1 Tax=Micromonospora sp. CPCC 205561 TaxID=3122407 RepID=UPI002FF351FF
MRRICFTLQVRPDRLDEYRVRHAHVWPDMLAALSASGWRDYSLFLREDGLLVGFLVTDDFAAARAAMRAHAVNARWQAEMAPFFVGLDHETADRAMRPLDEVFNLEAQLAARTGETA